MLKDLLNSGVGSTEIYPNKRVIITLNYISLILSFVFVLIFIARLIFYLSNPGTYKLNVLNFILGLGIFLSPIVMNRMSLTTLSQLSLCFMPVIFTWYLFIGGMLRLKSIEVSIYDGLRIYLLAFSFIPYLFFNNHKWVYLLLGILPTFLSFVLFEYLTEFFGISIYQKGNPGNDYLLSQARFLVAYIIISLGCYFFNFTINQNDEFNQKLLTILKERTDEIEKQYEELTLNQEMLNNLNNHLEDLVKIKTDKIEKKNAKLFHFSFSIAHHVRGPVARVLGLIQLFKMEADLTYPQIFEMVEKETKEIDGIIKQIGIELDDIEDNE